MLPQLSDVSRGLLVRLKAGMGNPPMPSTPSEPSRFPAVVGTPSSSLSPKDMYDEGPYPAGTPAMAAALAELFREMADMSVGSLVVRLLCIETSRATAGLATLNVVMAVPAVEGWGVVRSWIVVPPTLERSRCTVAICKIFWMSSVFIESVLAVLLGL